jgi:Tol biopolymer transport system component
LTLSGEGAGKFDFTVRGIQPQENRYRLTGIWISTDEDSGDSSTLSTITLEPGNGFIFLSQSITSGDGADRDVWWNGEELVPNKRMYSLGQIQSPKDPTSIETNLLEWGGFGPVIGEAYVIEVNRQYDSEYAIIRVISQQPSTYGPDITFEWLYPYAGDVSYPPTDTPIPPMEEAAEAPTPIGGGPGVIAFESDRDGNSEIYMMNADGNNPVRLTDNPAYDGMPAWSLDGSRIAFASERDGNSEIYVMDADGNNPIRLTDNPAYDGMPTWSPDGSRIAFTSDRDGNYEIYVLFLDTGTVMNLTNNSAAGDGSPAWSPDGKQIAFRSLRNGNNTGIYVIDADSGNNQMPLMIDPVIVWTLAWSPDGKYIAFVAQHDGKFDLYRINADGTEPIQLTNFDANANGASWSPDGLWIAFDSFQDGNREIYIVDYNGAGIKNLTNNPVYEGDPAWKP